MIGALLGDLWPYLAAFGAFMVTVAGAWLSGRRSGKAKAENRALKDSAKRMKDGRDAVDDMRGDGRAEWLKQLHKRDR